MKKIILAVFILALSGCATQTYNINGGTGQLKKDDMQTFFLSGIAQTQEVNAAKVCGSASKVVKVESKLEPLDIVLGTVTFGLYTPRHAKVYCKR